MGYYTKFELKASDKSVLKEIFCKHEEDNSLLSNMYEADLINDGVKIIAHCKWYEHDSDMKKVSEQFPDVLFTLDGFGSNSGDIWRRYYKNGLMQEAGVKICYEEFNPDKLKKIKNGY